jgi:hypothetical protein
VARLRWESGKNSGNGSGGGRNPAAGGGKSGSQGSDTRIFVDVGGRGGFRGRLVRWIGTAAVLVLAFLALEGFGWLPSFHNPFAETTTVRSGPVLLKSITELHKYEAASGEFEVVVELQNSSILPSFIQGSDTLFLGDGTVNAYVDFSSLTSTAVQVSPDRLSATIHLPHAKLEDAQLDVKKSYVIGSQQGLIDRLNSLIGGDPNAAQQLYVEATKKITDASTKSQLIPIAEGNTRNMLNGLLHSLGFTDVTVVFG